MRTWTWHRYGVYLDVQAVQVSLLGGRVFFVGLRYHGNNETILVQNGHITWSYWLRRVRDADVQRKKKGESTADSPDRQVGSDKADSLPCRLNVAVSGVEWFVYNRSAAYDAVLASLTEELDEEPKDDEQPGRKDDQHKLRRRQSKQFDELHGPLREKGLPNPPRRKESPESIRSSTSGRDTGPRNSAPATGNDELPLMLQLFPIFIECEKAAVVMGNDNTRAVLVVKAKTLSGEINAAATDTPDPYRQVFKFKLEEPVVEMRENEGYREDQASRATREKQVALDSEPPRVRSFFHRQRKALQGQLRNMIPYWNKSVESLSSGQRSAPGTAATQVGGTSHWQGLSRYLRDQDGDERTRWAGVEYAALNSVFESPEIHFSMFWDSVARVAPHHSHSDEAADASTRNTVNINGAKPPAWGISISVKGGRANYGPWADRQRAELQRTFFPGLSKDAKPATKLPVGAYRVATQFRLYVELEEEVILRIPVREESKNWRFRGKETGLKFRKPRDRRKSGAGRFRKPSPGKTATHQRPYGWLDIKIAANATVSYCMDMVATNTGFSITLDLDLPRTEISSSVNQQLLWRSGAQRISCDLSTPLKWNALRQWHFRVAGDDVELFVLRDHVFLLIDLVDDWASGPPTEYLTFTPFKYFLDVSLPNAKLFLNVNDANIISNPTSLNDNTFVTISSPLLHANVCIPLDNFRPPKNAIPFDLRAETASIGLHVPPWNTQATFLASKEIGHLTNLAVGGQYHYNATSSSANTDTLILNVSGQSPVANLHGFVIRYFLKLKDNYFGDDIHFKTLEEHQELLRLKETQPDAEIATRPPKVSNDLDVILNVRAENPRVLLPANLFSASRHVQLEAPFVSIDLRFTNYYMDLDLTLTPLNLSMGSANDGSETPLGATSNTQLFIDGLRIYGSRLFGLPPVEPTYLCNWDITVGAVTGECAPDFLTALINGGKALAFTFDDDENALIPYSAIIMYDVTFLRVSVESVQIWLRSDDAAFLVSSGPIDVNYNDWARSHYSRRASVVIPNLQLSCVDSEAAARHKSRPQVPVATNAFLKTSLEVAIVGRKANFTHERKLQQELVRQHDQRTRRTGFLLIPGLLDEVAPDPTEPPAQAVPPIPQPTTDADVETERDSQISSHHGSHRSRSLRHKASFLSVSSASQSSVVRPHSSRRSSVKSRHHNGLQPLMPLDAQAGRAAGHRREISSSTRHSAFYSAATDHSERKADPVHNTVAFSSQYFAPYFPLENIRPDTKEAMMQSIERDHDVEDGPDALKFNLEDIDSATLSEDFSHTSFLLVLPDGATAFCNPSALRSVVALLSALQPRDPEDIMDSIQTGAMSDIFGLQKDQKIKGHVADLVVRIPQANFRFLNSSDLDSSDPPKDEQDCYDVSITKFAMAARSQSKWEDAFDLDSRVSRGSFQARVASVEVAALERLAGFDEPQAAFLAEIEHVLVSMGSRDVTYLDIDVGSIQGSTPSEQMEYLASLIHRTSTLAVELVSLFSETLSRGDRIRRYLVHQLVTHGKTFPDPSFLVRPSAVLRSATQHLRTFDSWKLVSRLRQIWFLLGPTAKEQLRLNCLAGTQHAPEDARKQVADAFQRWRSWDLNDVARSVLLNNVFGKLQPVGGGPASALPFMAVLKLQQSQFALDPGPKQNEITFIDLIARVERRPRDADGAGGGESSSGGALTIINVCLGDAAICLNWELCELAEDIHRLYQRMQKTAKVVPNEERPVSKSAPEKTEETIHAVLAVTRGAVVLDTINLNVRCVGNNLNASLLMRTGLADTMDTNFILGCDAISTKVKSHSLVLSVFQLRRPSVFVSHELETKETVDAHTIKATASSQELSFAVKQDPLMLIETVDVLVKDEATQLYRLKQQLSTSTVPHPASPKKKVVDRLSAYRVNVVMFLDRYDISLPLLRSLTYNISGVVARASVAANHGEEFIFDFDIKENSHDMQVTVKNTPRSISLLQIPPTNGRITSLMGETGRLVKVFASLELVQLDASAVYSLLSALNRPEISNTLNDLQGQAKLLQEHFTEVSGGTGSPGHSQSAAKQSTPTIYSLHSTFAGLKILGRSPLKSDTSPQAQLLFWLDSVQLEVGNRQGGRGRVLAHPEFHVNLRQIAFDIQRGTEDHLSTCGSLGFGALITASSTVADDGTEHRFFQVQTDGLDVTLSPETVSTMVDVLGYMGDKIKDLDTSRELEYLRKLRQSRPRIAINDQEEEEEEEADIIESFLSSIEYSLEVRNIQVAWLCIAAQERAAPTQENLVLSLEMIEFGTRTKKSARLTIQNLQLQMVPPAQDTRIRSVNSALLPEVIFNIAYVSTAHTRRLAFQAIGKSLDLRLTSGFIVPAANLNQSIGLSVKNVQDASQHWNPITLASASAAPLEGAQAEPRRTLLGNKRLESLLIDADFAGAVVHLTGRKPPDEVSGSSGARGGVRPGLGGKYGQFNPDESGSSTVLRTPGLAWKLEYRDHGRDDPSLYAEVRVDASSNILYPTVVPLVMDITSSIKEVVSDDAEESKPTAEPKADENPAQEDNILTADPSAVLGRIRLNLGLRICRQQFSLSCQPIARVAATASFDDVYFTMNTVRSAEHGHFFAISGAFRNLRASVQHVYSRESTGSFGVESIVVSLMNSKHVSGTSGVSAIIKVSPMKVDVNARQLQDFLLFREIWTPREIRMGSAAPVAKLATETSQAHLVQRYQQVAATAAFPWTATISISALEISVDLGQALGKSEFAITEFWVSSKKTSDWEQNLCLGFQKIGIDSTGRMSGFVALQDFKLRTSIQWPERERALNETPMIQASIAFSQFRVKAGFDYSASLVADITSMEFLMYNVRHSRDGSGDRLVASFDGEAVQVFGTTSSAAQGIALYQAFQKLVQERRANFETSLKEIEKFMRRSSAVPEVVKRLSLTRKTDDETLSKSPISLDTDVVVTLKTLNLGVFPSAFTDHQIFKMEALNAQARFAASIEAGRIHSVLGLTLGQLRIGLAAVRHVQAPKTLSDLAVEDVVLSATGSRGGTILKVPEVEAVMQTWQSPESKQIEYIFKSAFSGKVEVGWNYSRISYIRGMWANHSKTLAQTWGRELPLTAIKVTGVPELESEDGGGDGGKEHAKKITAEVHVPQSKYEYVALEPAIIETPQLRDMGEATPPLEWIGLHRDRLPNLTHQIVIVTLLELAGEVEDAYSRILGSS